MKWLLSIPAWGDPYRRVLETQLRPTLDAAIEYAGIRLADVRAVIQTDDAGDVRRIMRGYDLTVLPVPAVVDGENGAYTMFGDAHRQGLAIADVGEAVCFLCADMQLSVECFAASAFRFRAGKQIIMVSGTRVAEPAGFPMCAQDLLQWAMQNPHPSVLECYWQTGKAQNLWGVYFPTPEGIYLRPFVLHPFAAIKQHSGATFGGNGVDLYFPYSYQAEDWHVVTKRDEMAIITVEPMPKHIPPCDVPISAERVADWMKRWRVPTAHWLFLNHAVEITGSAPALDDDKPLAEIRSFLA